MAFLNDPLKDAENSARWNFLREYLLRHAAVQNGNAEYAYKQAVESWDLLCKDYQANKRV